jgi:hypothetical protein
MTSPDPGLLPGPAVTGPDEAVNNRWEKLRPLLDPVVVNTPPEEHLWQQLPVEMVTWLVNTLAPFPWLNHLALAGLIFTRHGLAHPYRPVRTLHYFLRWAIPEHYAALADFEPEAALAAYYGDPPHVRGREAAAAYRDLQMHAQRFLETLAPAQRTALRPFLLPPLQLTGRLRKLKRLTTARTQAVRKEQAHAVVKRLPDLVGLARRRYRWLADLDAQVQQVAEAVQRGEADLPVLLQLADLEGRPIVFRVWDHLSWIIGHLQRYAKTAQVYARRLRASRAQPQLFLQLVGEIPESSWFLRAVALGVLQNSRRVTAVPARRYLAEWGLTDLGLNRQPGLLSLDSSLSKTLVFARRAAAATPEDSRVLFAVEPLLAGAAVGLFTLMSIVATGMRIGEWQQVSLDRECMVTGHLPEWDDPSGQWVQGPSRICWLLYPKGRAKPERYLVTQPVVEAMFILLDLHTRYCGKGFQPVAPGVTSEFSHARRFHGQRKFVLQWAGRHIGMESLNRCLTFLLLEHGCTDSAGRPVNLTSHLLRHGVAGWLRTQGIALDEIMALLKHVNLSVTDYYSQLSPDDLHRQLGPALTALAELAGSDPATLRTVGDIQNLAQAALKRYGALRHTPGGLCAVYTPCEVQFLCAGCPHFLPDPRRRPEIEEKIASHSRAIQLFGELGDHLQAETQRAHLQAWQRIEKELAALEAVALPAPPAETVLKNLGADELGAVLLRNLDAIQRLPSGDPTSNDQED